ncbi:MAG: DNA glycosylase [Verrucomicrobiota bacterium]
MTFPRGVEIPLDQCPINLGQTLHSGQVFHWHEEGPGYLGLIGSEPVYLVGDGCRLVVSGEREAGLAARVARYLGLDHPLQAIIDGFRPDDEPLAAALAFCPGIRILRQPRWECLATFITSSLKQVPQIRKISLTLRERYGEKRTLAGRVLHTYPEPAALARAGEAGLRECGLGFRARGLALAAERIASGEVNLDELDRLDDEALRRALCGFHGVGEKIADCVLLFAYERHSSFPIDVWVERIVRQLYYSPRRRKALNHAQIQKFARRQFGRHAGYAQQYLFHYARMNDKVLFKEG